MGYLRERGVGKTMHINTTEDFQIDLSGLDRISQIYKDYYIRHPELHLDTPVKSSIPPELLSRVLEVYNDVADVRVPNTSSDELTEGYLNRFHSDIAIEAQPNYQPVRMHQHTFFELACVIQGSCYNYSGNRTLMLRSGDILLIAPGTSHALSSFHDDCLIFNIIIRRSKFEETFFHMFSDHDILHHFFSNILYRNKTNSFIQFHTDDDPKIKASLLSLYQLQTSRQYYGEELKASYLGFIFEQMVYQHTKDMILFSDSESETHHDVIYIIRYMQEHFQDLTLDKLAAFFGYSTRHISRILLTYTGNNFQENLKHIRLQYALQLLRDPAKSIEDIAVLSGYGNDRNMRKAFQNEFQMSPSEYRKKKLGKPV